MGRTCDKRLHSGNNRDDEITTHHCRPTSRPVRPRLSSAPGNTCSASPATVHTAPTSLMVTVQLRNGSVLQVALDSHGCSRLKRISDLPSLSPTSHPKTGQTGDRYDPPLVLRTSEWVSESLQSKWVSNMSTDILIWICKKQGYIYQLLHDINAQFQLYIHRLWFRNSMRLYSSSSSFVCHGSPLPVISAPPLTLYSFSIRPISHYKS